MKKDFTIKKGTKLVGSLKPNKVKAHKTYMHASGITPAGISAKNNLVAKVNINNK